MKAMLIEKIAKNALDDQQNYSTYRPSPSKVGRCLRSLVYEASGIKPDLFPARALLVFEDGNIHEELIKDHIRKTDFELVELKGKHQRFKIGMINGYEMTGEIDGLITDSNGIVRVLEIKSINHFSFERLEEDPQEDHRHQLNLYIHGLREAGYKEISQGLIIYKNKNTANMKEFIIDYDREMALNDLNLFESIEKMASDGIIPARPFEQNSWQCSYCRWNQHCYKGYELEFKALSDNRELSDDLEISARYYNELGGQITELQLQREEAKTELKKGLDKAGAKSGRVGDYLIERKMYVKQKIDKKMVPVEAISEVLEERFFCRSLTGGKKE